MVDEIEKPDYDKPLDEDPSVMKINASPKWAWFALFIRQVALLGSSFMAILSYFQAHDLAGLFRYLGTHEFLAAAMLAVSVGILGWGYVREWLHKRKLVKAAQTPLRKIDIKNLKEPQ